MPLVVSVAMTVVAISSPANRATDDPSTPMGRAAQLPGAAGVSSPQLREGLVHTHTKML
jgi:hypothetical protein